MKEIAKIFILIMALTTSAFAQIPSTLPVTDGSVLVTVLDGNGGVYIGGLFTTVGGQPHSNIAHIKPNGTVDDAFTGSTDDVVYALSLSGTNLFVGGKFANVNGVPASFFASLDSSTGTTINGIWTMAYDGVINFMTINSGILYVSGAFTTITQSDGTQVSRQNLGSITISSGMVTSFDPSPSGTVYAMQFSSSTPGLVFMGGAFSTMSGNIRSSLAAYDLNTSTLYPWNPATDGTVNALVLVGNTLFVGGRFLTINRLIPRHNAVSFGVSSSSLNTTNPAPFPWDPNSGPLNNGTINSMVDDGSGTIYITGAFTTMGGNSRLGFAAVNETNGAVTALTHSLTGAVNSVSGFGNDLQGSSVITDGANVAVGGSFSTVDGQASQSLALFLVKTAQSISFAPLATKTYGDPSFTLSATASSGNTVTYASSDPTVATISGNTVTIVGAGTTNITASQAGDATYAASSMVQPLVVSKATLTAKANDASKTYGDPNPSFSISYTGFLFNDDVSSITTEPTASTTATPASSVGTATITLSGGLARNYTFTTQNGILTINKKIVQAISDNKTKVYGDINPNFTIRYVGFVNGDNESSLTTVPIVDVTNFTETTPVNNYQILLYGGAADNYSFDYSNSGNLTVTPAPLSITANDLSKIYGAVNPKLTKSFVGFVNHEDSTVLQNIPTLSTLATTSSSVGTYPIALTATGSNLDGNYDVTLNNGTLTVNKADQTVTFAPLASKAYNDAPFTLSATSSSGLAITYTSDDVTVATVNDNVVTIIGVGTANITASQAGDNNYNAASASQPLTVTSQNSQTITFNSLATKTFGDPDFSLDATSTSGLAITFTSSNLNVATVAGNTVTIIGAGTTNITALQAGDANFAASSMVQTLTINKADQTVTFNLVDNIKTFGNPPFSLNTTSTSNLPVTYISDNLDVATVTGNTVTIVGAGVANIIASQAGDDNHNPAIPISQTLTINKADQTITFNALTNKKFGDPTFMLDATASSRLAVTYLSSDPTIATITGSVVTILKVGTVTITASQSGNSNYNAATNDISQTLTIDKANQNITFNLLSNKKIGDANFTLGATVNSGLTITYTSDNETVATVTGNTVTIVGAGTATITASQAGDDNYAPAPIVTQLLTVTNKTDQTITFNSLATKTFGDAPFSLSATASSGLAVTYTSSDPTIATISGNTVTLLKAGTVTITASQSGNSTYAAAPNVDQTLTIMNKADQTITFNSLADKKFGDPIFTLDATTSSGLVVTYASSDPTTATISGSTVTILKAGTVTITASQLGNINYNAATDVSRTLTINKANQTITFNPFTVSNSFTLDASSTSKLAVTFSSSDPAIATISGNVVTVLKAGTVTFTASQSGNSNYNAAVDVPRTTTIVVTGVELTNSVKFSMYPNPTSNALIIETGDTGFKEIQIYSIDGRLVDTIQSNEKEIKIIVSNYTNGLYIAKVVTPSGLRTEKFEKN